MTDFKNYKNRVPVILNRGTGNIVELTKEKFLVNKETTLGQFMCVLRKKNTISSTQAIFVFCNNVLPQSSTTMEDLWNQHKEDDDILYLTYSAENTFG